MLMLRSTPGAEDSSGQDGSSGRRLMSANSGGVQVAYFPGAGGSGGGGGGWAPPSDRPTWTIVAVANVAFSGSQCFSSPVTINTDCWWNWLYTVASWFKAHRHHHHHHIWFGRRRMAATATATAPATGRQLQEADGAAAISSTPAGCPAVISQTAFLVARPEGGWAVLGDVTLGQSGGQPGIKSVKVTVANSIAFKPLIVPVYCHADAPGSGITKCVFTAQLPAGGASAHPAVWTAAMAQVALADCEGTACNGSPAPLIRA